MKHLLSIEALSPADIRHILQRAADLKRSRRVPSNVLTGEIWAMIFSKSSTRTRVSFEVGIRELGGQVLFLPASEIQLGRGEPIKDTARVLGRMVHGAIFRTFAQADVEEFARCANIPTINALTDEEHPCQILADIFTIEEKLDGVQDKVITFIGDGACNVANSWIFAAAKCGFELRIAAPKQFQPDPKLLSRADGRVTVTTDVNAAAEGADVLYTDVWVSMGKEAEAKERLDALRGYQVNNALVKRSRPGVLVMHCLPAYRGMEIDADTFEANAQTIFDQAENRLHVQKGVLAFLKT